MNSGFTGRQYPASPRKKAAQYVHAGSGPATGDGATGDTRIASPDRLGRLQGQHSRPPFRPSDITNCSAITSAFSLNRRKLSLLGDVCTVDARSLPTTASDAHSTVTFLTIRCRSPICQSPRKCILSTRSILTISRRLLSFGMIDSTIISSLSSKRGTDGASGGS